MAGLSTGADQAVLRGDLAAPGFAVYHFREGRLVAVDTVNNPREHLQARKLIEAGVAVTPVQAADPGCDLARLIGSPGAKAT
jgi:3-phenylpropionate/trans-cinnamate dioxygenase ferredoxin reductase subunit